MKIADLLARDRVSAVSGPSAKRQVLAHAAELAARACGLEASALAAGLNERELLGSTGLGSGVAVPHARSVGVERPFGVFLRLDTPVAFQALDDQPVDLVFALFAPERAGVEHLQALASVSRFLRSEAVRDALRDAADEDVLYALLTQDREAVAA
ncbi:PTS sugar transporter subunit IIA [Brevundimonas sp. 2R-24]|uniref:PTS sugar transporter subunit IIA n=1 Tax=Peiella sedimenti TaxID=3061083 RepID=A0ABT8SIM2_9CAUL|nr:PTS sugar transporter subunit IIA [Caulobacteraceae bacterium XZ-24]